MNNRNMVAFVVSMVVLFGAYTLVMKRFYPQQPEPAAVVQKAEAPAQPKAQAPVPASPSAADPRLADPRNTVTVESNDLRVSFRAQDGAIQQVEWKADGTPFLPSLQADGSSKDFPGLGGVPSVRFEGTPEIQSTPDGKAISFRTAQGDRLEYQIPAKGFVLGVNWTAAKGAPMNLIARPQDEKEAHRLGRVFTLGESSITSVNWMDMMKDPFFSFVGAKRKVLPDATSRVGMDAGLEKTASRQGTHYFAAIWELGQTAERDPQMGYTARPDAQGKLSAKLFLGPKQAEALSGFGKPYTKVLDFGFFGLVSQVLFWILRMIQSVIPNWGWAILVFSLLLRLVLWPLNTKTTVSMIRMKELEPHQKALQAKYEKFGNDMTKKAEMQKELMAFYKKNGHNPMGGCLPMLCQMPVFLALWSMLNAVYELRHAHFALWLTDLSAKDPFYILPILLGVTMVAQQLMTPATGDAMQRKMMLFMMPAMMVFFFATTPAGLCLYYLIFNLVGMGQTWWLTKTYKSKPIVV
ncbi:membrane protein insertase YidC [Holophaga foetida]|uniref:membrane protein insertase YidC n=1 Tax=Holophaga foetida TaxID=35839 RepID=UPI0002474D50|nr:YidC/Oxa1 family insertase periplasmic-domain containing protein [Holophaga foetida]